MNRHALAVAFAATATATLIGAHAANAYDADLNHPAYWETYLANHGTPDAHCTKTDMDGMGKHSWTAEQPYVLVVVKAATDNKLWPDVKAGDVVDPGSKHAISHVIACTGGNVVTPATDSPTTTAPTTTDATETTPDATETAPSSTEPSTTQPSATDVTPDTSSPTTTAPDGTTTQQPTPTGSTNCWPTNTHQPTKEGSTWTPMTTAPSRTVTSTSGATETAATTTTPAPMRTGAASPTGSRPRTAPVMTTARATASRTKPPLAETGANTSATLAAAAALILAGTGLIAVRKRGQL